MLSDQQNDPTEECEEGRSFAKGVASMSTTNSSEWYPISTKRMIERKLIKRPKGAPRKSCQPTRERLKPVSELPTAKTIGR